MENNKGEIVLYNPIETISLEVRFEYETVWLNTSQMALLFAKEESNIRRHIINVFNEGELKRDNNVRFLHVNGVKKSVPFYSLDVIISVGYRVKSFRGTTFRQWANKILKEHLLRGYSLSQRISDMERRIDYRFYEHEKILQNHSEQIDFFIKTSLPPKEGIFFNGEIFDAYVFVSDLVKRAKKRIVLIDNYIDESVLLLLSKRKENVEATIYTQKISEQLLLDIQKHNNQYLPIEVKMFRQSHDRFMIIDDELYWVGASLKDLGKKWFGFSKMESFSTDAIIARLES
ncbi:MAG: virulence RhuM family protein [Bacteroidales bacterium]|nr:virulence RhuM family protein [Bacteroidales bacterium]